MRNSTTLWSWSNFSSKMKRKRKRTWLMCRHFICPADVLGYLSYQPSSSSANTYYLLTLSVSLSLSSNLPSLFSHWIILPDRWLSFVPRFLLFVHLSLYFSGLIFKMGESNVFLVLEENLFDQLHSDRADKVYQWFYTIINSSNYFRYLS